MNLHPLVKLEHIILFHIGKRRRSRGANLLFFGDHAFDRREYVFHRRFASTGHGAPITYREAGVTPRWGCSAGVTVLVATGVWRGSPDQSFQSPATRR